MIFLEFKDNTGNIPSRSGINQNLSVGHTSQYDAYIPVKVNAISSGLIPVRPTSSGGAIPTLPVPITVTWDDGHVMNMMFDGSQNINGTIYPKNLSSTPTRNDLGFYLRNRMRLYNSTGALDTRQIINSDFSVPNPGIELDCINGQWEATFIY